MRRLLALFLAMATLLGPAFSQKKETYKVRTVVIDPGHGGAKPGAKGSRSFEKDITLEVALKFGKLIQDNYPDVKVIYTRTSDVDISLAERAHIANRNKADLFVSVHANSHPTSSPTGVETFVMGLSESKANLEVARKENADILLEADYKNNSDYQGFDPSAPETYVMLAMFQSAFLDKSLNFAQYIQNQYRQNIKTINRGVKQAELFVLYKTSMPSVLTEIGFISNPAEESYMLSDEGQATIAVCLFNAFMNYKSVEEGTPRLANPVIKLKGYGGYSGEEQNVATQEKPAGKADVVAGEKPAPAERKVVAPPSPEPVSPSPVPQQTAAAANAPTSKPVPSAEMPRRVEPAQPVQPARPAAVQPVQPARPVATQPARTAHTNGLQLPNNTASSDRQFYTVQFMLHDRILQAGARELQGIDEYDVIRKKNGLAYCCGRFATFQEATDYCNRLKSATRFKDAWVFLCKLAAGEEPAASVAVERARQNEAAASYGFTPDSQEEQIRTMAAPDVQQLAAGEGDDGETVYRVQFLTSPREMQRGDPDLCGITDIKIEQYGNSYVYLAGYFTTRREAEQRCAGIKLRTPFKDAYVVAYRNGERVK